VYNGELKWTTPKKSEECSDFTCWEGDCEEKHTVRDSRGDYSDLTDVVYLPHACDEWVIGGPEQVRKLITDLELWLEAQKSP